MKYIKVLLIALFVITSSGCSSLEAMKSLDAVADAGSAVSDLKNGKINSPTDLGKVDIGKAVSAGADIGKAFALSDEEVKQMAMRSANHMDRRNRVAPRSSKYAKRLRRLTRKHRKEDGLTLNYKAYLTPEINAFALSDGSIRVYSGLMDMLKDDNQLLSVIGHEIGHVKRGHMDQQMRLAYAASGLRKGAASMNNVAGAIAGSDLGGLVEKLLDAQFSQSHENEADDYSLEFLQRSGYRAQASVEVLQKLAALEEKHGGNSNEIRFLSSHPAPGRRAKRLAKALDSNGKSIKRAALKTPSSSSSRTTRLDAPTNTQRASSNSQVYASARTLPSAKRATLRRARPSVQVINRIDRGWYIQLCAETEHAEAAQKVNSLDLAGHPSRMQEAIVRGTRYFRVLVGPYPSKSIARAYVTEARSVGVSDEIPFLKRVR